MSQHFLTEHLIVEEVEPCPLCNGTNKVTDMYSGEVVCTNCGCVLNNTPMNRGVNGENYYHQRDNNTRRHGQGMRPSVYDKGLNTRITGKKDAFGVPIKQEDMKRLGRLKKHDNRSKTNESVMRNLAVAMAELDRLCTVLNLPDYMKEYAALIYRSALSKDLIRGRSIDAFVAASIYAACRMKNLPRPLKTVADESKRLHKEVSMTYRMLLEELELRPPIDKPFKYVPKLAAKLDIPRPTELKAMELLRDAEEGKFLAGKDPRGVAAAALYLASTLNGEKVVQSKIARAAETTEVTLRNRYRGLKKALEIV